MPYFVIRSSARGFTLIELLVVIAVIAVLVAILLPAVQSARESARRNSCKNNLKQLGLALHNYHDAHNIFPTGGYGERYGGITSPGPSWGVMILPYIEQASLYDQLKPGNPSQFVANATSLPVFKCPTDPYADTIYTSAGASYTTVRKSIDGTCNNDRHSTQVTFDSSGEPYAAAANYGLTSTFSRSYSIAKIKAGTSRFLLLAERDQLISPMIWVGIPGADGTDSSRTKLIPYTMVRNGSDGCATQAPLNATVGQGGVVVFTQGRPNLAGVSNGWGSAHKGGVQICLADGSVRFLSDNVGKDILYGLSTPAVGADIP